MRSASRLTPLWMLVLSAAAFAAQPAPKNAPLPPPPGINDPGVSTPAAPQATNQDPTIPLDVDTATDAGDPLAPIAKPDTRLVRDKADRDPSTANAQRIAESDVTTRTQGNDTVEEYRQNGHVWMIRIIPPDGPMQTFLDSNGSGHLSRDPQQGPVSPVYFSLYEWN